MKKKAVVIGGGGLLGKAVCRQLEDSGFELDQLWLSKDRPDVRDPDAFSSLPYEFEAGIYLAGINVVKPAEEMTLSEWGDVLDINLTGFFEFTRACLPAFKRNGGGHLVAISSIMVTHPYPMRSAYAASKAGLEGLIRSLAIEWGKYNVKVNGLRLGHLNGLMKSTSINPNFLESVKSKTPNNNLVNPEAVGKYIEWLLLDSDSCISGSIIDFDPAYTINRWPLAD
jgi:3-oxoacyl-[acyl-carrier protein] reductase